MQWLVKDARPNDSLFFHCVFLAQSPRILYAFLHLYLDSGHGGQTPDLDGDEADGFDEGSVFARFIRRACGSFDQQ